ncbi:FecR domain-containing protein [Achromobacter insuavis]|uniref:FecR domain-containing protein n=1 Tax=Achromobacter insuavis TaxID=1287735 RepID=UPI0035A0DAB4
MTSPSPLAAPGLYGAIDDSLEQAAEWYALLRSGQAAADDHGRWQAWLDADARHREAWSYVERISQRFDPIQRSPVRRPATEAYRLARARLTRRRVVLGLAGGGALAWITVRHSPVPDLALAWMADHRTGTGEIRELALSDGTRVWLNTASAFDDDYDAQVRRLVLRSGEVLIQTAPDPARPFLVSTPYGQLRALGTRFTVRIDGADALLAVYEGAVEIRTADGGLTQVVPAGRQARYSRTAIDAGAPADPAREAWSRGILIAQDIPLSEVLRELARYQGGHLGASADVAGIRVLGSYPLTEPDRALAMLAAALPIRIRRSLPWWTSVEARP